MSRFTMSFEGKVYRFTVEAQSWDDEFHPERHDPAGIRHAGRAKDDHRTPLERLQAAVQAEAESRVEDGPYRCASCGSAWIEAAGSITLNSETISSMDEDNKGWCPDCEDHEARMCYLIVNEIRTLSGGQPVDRVESCDFHKRPYSRCRADWDPTCVAQAKDNREARGEVPRGGLDVTFQ